MDVTSKTTVVTTTQHRVNLNESERFVLKRRYGIQEYVVDTIFYIDTDTAGNPNSDVEVRAAGYRKLKSGKPSTDRPTDSWQLEWSVVPEPIVDVLRDAGLW